MSEPVHEPEPTPLTADDKVWLAGHPKTRWTLIVGKKLIMPALAISLPIYFNFRIDRDKLKASDGYSETAKAIKDLQAAVAKLNDQMEPTQKLALVQSVKPQPVAPSATLQANVALEQYKKNLVLRVQKSQDGHTLLLRALPEKLEDVPATKK